MTLPRRVAIPDDLWMRASEWVERLTVLAGPFGDPGGFCAAPEIVGRLSGVGVFWPWACLSRLSGSLRPSVCIARLTRRSKVAREADLLSAVASAAPSARLIFNDR